MADEALTYFAFAQAFGWTPTQVDDQPAILIDWMLAVAEERGGLAAIHRPQIQPGR